MSVTDRSPFKLVGPSRRHVAGGLAVSVAALVAGCADVNTTFPSVATPSGPTNQPTGNTIGNGPVRIALILPLSAPNGAVPAQALRNAAEMAIAEFNSQELTILVKDDKGTPEGAQAAAQEALSEGAEAILGPLFAPAVSAAASVARGASRPVIAFSTDASVAARGVYLLSFMPQSDVRRIVSFATQRGKKSFAALIPQSAYGSVAEAEFAQAVTSSGARLAMVERYQPNKASIDAAIAKIKAGAQQVDSLFIPDDGNGLPGVGAALQGAGISSRSMQLLGTGVWNEARVFRTAALSGAWFAAPENAGFQNFAQRYRSRFNSDPTRIATLAYDATALLSALVRTQGAQRFSEGVLTNASGFAGQDGVFRFRQDGTNDRGLAIYQLGNGSAQVIQPAPRTFAAGSA
ncbi:MAG TPA: penicillin-binding protein activator [Beijerinckiaceae bacterium]|nr:penicillin-binding protein activator [Beijerinckiaceae bacterium]